MTDAEGRITTEARDRLLLIGIDRPAKLNGFSPTMLQQLAEAYTELERNDDHWCGVLFAYGDNFTAGLELDKVAAAMKEKGRLWPEDQVDPLDLRPPHRVKPVIAAVKGYCYTLGIELMLAADMVVAASNTQFSQLEVKRGIMATGGATIRMVERAGWGNAMKHLLTGDVFDAAEALRLGFVQEVVAPGEELPRALALAASIAEQAPLAVRATRLSALKALTDGPGAAIAAFALTQRTLMASTDAVEGVKSFTERRKAVFKGE
jgi:enoyl-CoA hydratase/carnithine racemase